MSSVYIHVPFCKSRCIYCDFYSTTDARKRSRYVECLKHELEMRRSYLPFDEEVSSIYFGGGTPSQLSPAMLSSVLETVHRLFRVSSVCRKITVIERIRSDKLACFRIMRYQAFWHISFCSS